MGCQLDQRRQEVLALLHVLLHLLMREWRVHVESDISNDTSQAERKRVSRFGRQLVLVNSLFGSDSHRRCAFVDIISDRASRVNKEL